MALGIDEVLGSFGLLQDLLGGHTEQLHDAGQLVPFVLAGKQRVARQQLGQYAAEAPHVNGEAVARAQDHLRRTVEARLDVGVDSLVFEAAGAKVNYLAETGRKKTKCRGKLQIGKARKYSQALKERKLVRGVTLMPLRPCCLSRMFSGFRSQWMILCRCRASRHCRMECANFLTSGKLKPWNLLRLMSSYRFMLSSSKVMHMWLRKVKFSSMCTTFMVPLRSCLRRCSKMRISSCACRWKRFSLRTILRAKCCWSLWS